jgi:RimJ/RimL family protein N-acetyltransferase
MEQTLDLSFTSLTEPTTEYMDALTKWENDPVLVPLMRVCKNEQELKKRMQFTLEGVKERLEKGPTWLIRMDGRLIGEMGYQADPEFLHKKESGTAWIGITVGEEIGRGKGIGFLALQHLEEQIKFHGLKRMELGAFEFNTNAIKLYKKLGFMEFARIEDFTYWDGKMWQDIQMEKYV